MFKWNSLQIGDYKISISTKVIHINGLRIGIVLSIDTDIENRYRKNSKMQSLQT